MKPNCLIIDDMHPSILSALESVGIETTYRPEITRDEVLQLIPDFEGIIVRSKIKIDQELISKAKKLKYIARAGAGKDNIDLIATEQAGITILNAPEGNRDAVAEHVIGMILALLNKLATADREVRKFIWQREENRGTELGNKTVGIIGFGNTGKEVAKRITCFGCRVLAYDIRGINQKVDGVEVTSMEEIFKHADIITLHIPLDTHNRKLVNAEFLEKFEKNIWIINTARGEIIDTAALVNALQAGKVIGAGLDVLENEKLATLTAEQKKDFDQLTAMSNVLFSPHVAGWTTESYIKISLTLGEKIEAFYRNN